MEKLKIYLNIDLNDGFEPTSFIFDKPINALNALKNNDIETDGDLDNAVVNCVIYINEKYIKDKTLCDYSDITTTGVSELKDMFNKLNLR